MVTSMGRFWWLVSFVVMTLAPSVYACEGCKEPSNVAGASGVIGISTGFSLSVIFMLGMLAVLMTGMLLMIRRACRQLDARHQSVAVQAR